MSIQADNWAREEHATAIAEGRGCYHCFGLAYGIEAAKQAGQVVGFPPDLSGNFMILNGTRFPVINAWTENESSDGRKRWGIVTESPAEEQSAQQPAAPTGATPEPAALDPYSYTGPLKDPGGFLQAFSDLSGRTANVNPPEDPITPEEHAEGARYIERPSGPPVRVDGPGCTPAVAEGLPSEAELMRRIFPEHAPDPIPRETVREFLEGDDDQAEE